MSKRYRLGDHVELRVQTHDANGAPVVPDSCPTITVYNSAGTVIKSATAIPIQDRYGATGLFNQMLFLDASYTTGHYIVRYKWTASAFNGVRIGTFKVIAGGNAAGQYISMAFLKKPFADYLVGETDSGSIERVRNPKF